MPQIDANDIKIETEVHGDPSGTPVLLIMGLAAQLTHWPPAMIGALTNAGYRVITFDNRDIGLSQKLHSKRAPRPAVHAFLSQVFGFRKLAPYTLEDMAKDTVGVLDAYDVEKAHVIGVSMGGMIGQVMAAKYPDRLLSFAPVMSSTNHPRLPKADPAIIREIFTVRTQPRSREDLIDRSVALWNLIGTPDGGHDPEEFRARLAAAVDRSTYPAGIRRQIAAIIASGDLRRYARKITAPTLVVHGSIDPLAPMQGGLDIAATTPGASAKIIDGMGHDLPPRHLNEINELLIGHMKASEETQAARAA